MYHNMYLILFIFSFLLPSSLVSAPLSAPSWPYRSLPYNFCNILYSSFSYRCASKAYDSCGDTESVAVIPFKKECTEWQDIIAQSRLLGEGKLQSTSSPGESNPFSYLAQTPVRWKGSIEEIDLSFDYVQQIGNRHLSLAIHMPFSYKRYKIDPTFCLSETAHRKVGEVGDPIHDLYGGSVSSFFTALLCDRGITFERKESARGIGDTIISLQLEPYCRALSYATVTFSLIIPTAKQRNVTRLWAPDLGNGGFYGLQCAGAAMIECHSMFNPHLYLAPTVYFPADILRRSLRTLSHTPNSTRQLCGLVADYLAYVPSSSFSSQESCFAAFGGNLGYVNSRRGFDLNVIMGNVFKGCLLHRDYLDLFYQLMVKNKDHISSCDKASVFTPPMGHASSHTLGLSYSLHIDDKVWIRGALRYVVAGKVAPRYLEFAATCAAQF